MNVTFSGSGYADPEGDQQQIEIRAGLARFSFWFPADKAELIKESFLVAMEQGKAEIADDRRERPASVAVEIGS